VFATDSLFHPSLIFANKCGAYMSEAPFVASIKRIEALKKRVSACNKKIFSLLQREPT